MRPGEFINLTRRTRRAMIRASEGILTNPIIAEEVVEEAIIYWTENMDKLPSHLPTARSYLVKTTKDRAHNKRRNLLSVGDTRIMATIANQLMRSTPGADKLVEDAEEAYSEEVMVLRLQAAIGELPPTMRALAQRVWFYGQDITDAANEMGIKYNTAHKSLERARTRVRKMVRGGGK